MAEYDPKAKYGWDAETEFKLSGNEFGLILNTFRTVLASPESQKILAIDKASTIIEEVLARNVEDGKVNLLPTTPITQPLKKVEED